MAVETEENTENTFEGLQEAINSAREAKNNGGEQQEQESDQIIIDETPVTDAPASEETSTTNTIDTPDYAKYFETISEGFVKNEEDFKTTIAKAKSATDLENRIKDLETKIPQFKNDESRELYERLLSGDTDALDAYREEKRKNYTTMSDGDIVRESLSKKNPNWTKAEVELELRYQYGENLEKINLDDIDKEDENGKITNEYAEAVAHNKDVDNNLMKLQRDARDARPTLLEHQSKIELPKINKTDAPTAAATPTDAEIAERTAKWISDVKSEMPNFKAIKSTIDNKEVEYALSEDDQKEAAGYMEKFTVTTFAKDRGWLKEDGTPDILKIAEDRQKLKDFDKIQKTIATQVKTDTTKQVIGKIKNIDGTTSPADTDQAFNTLEEAVADAKKKAGWKNAS